MKRDYPIYSTHKISPLLAGIVLLFPLILGCVSLRQKNLETIEEHAVRPEPVRIPPDVSLESLEEDPTFLEDLAPERRANEISRLWFEHGLYLERSSYTGAFAAFSRATHIAAEALLSENCITAISKCPDLDQSYKRSLGAVTKLLAQNSWKPPSLERTRYRLTQSSIQTIKALSAWKFAPTYPSDNSARLRPGFGLPVVGCRQIRGDDTTCSPLTLVMTFASQPSTESFEATISAYDAFQQEVLPIENTHIPLAGHLELAAHTLVTLAHHSEKSALYCLSLPTAQLATSVLLVETSQTPIALQRLITPLLRDATITDATTICIQTIGNSAETSFSPFTALSSLRAAHSLPQGSNLTSGTNQPLVVIAFGQRASNDAIKLPRAMGRFRNSRGRRRTLDAPFKLSSIVNIGVDETNQPATQSGVGVLVHEYPMPCDTACVAGIKRAILESGASNHQSDHLEPDPLLRDEDLPLSPVI